ncbi:MAG: hypothetical protein IJR99_14715 [Kiritimatiellae bacterium]|nr:hypothetical protein [Kiritimatiellia bacterium]
MGKLLCLIFGIGINSAVYGWTGESQFELAATNAICHTEILIQPSFTNELHTYMLCNAASKTEVSAGIVWSVCQLEFFEETADDRWLSSGKETVSNLLASALVQPCDWQYWCARIAMLPYCNLENKTKECYQISTNLLSEMECSGFVDSDNSIVQSLLRYNRTAGLSVRDSVKLSAAMAAAELGYRNEALLFSTNLPHAFVSEIRAILRH